MYTLRDVPLSFDGLLARVAEAGFEGVEFAYRVPEEDPDAVRRRLADVGLDAASAHVPIGKLEGGDAEPTREAYARIGCDDIVVPGLDAEYFRSETGIGRAVDRLDAAGSRLDAAGTELHYHNHDHEYADVDGRAGFLRFIEASDVSLELDVGFLKLAGDDPVERIDAVGDRCRLLHLKDVDLDAGKSVPLGEGDVDLEAVAAAFRRNGGEWLIYEYEGADPLATLGGAADRLRELC